MKNLHLIVSAIVIILVALAYGVSPSTVLPNYFDFSVTTIDLSNIFRALMGLYLALAIFWTIGILNPSYWKAATLSNILFMGGLASGRVISMLFNGIPSNNLVFGLISEMIFLVWGIVNLNKFKIIDN